MRKRTTVPLILTLIVGLGLFGVYSLSTHTATPVAETQIRPQSKYDVGPPDAQELLELVNAERAKVGVAPLVIDERLNKSAQMKADDMVKYNYFGHMNHDGTQAYQVVGKVAAGLCTYASENIRDNDEYINTSREAFTAWVNSKPHHTAMIDTRYSLTGFGIMNDQVVEHFCITR